MKKLPLLAPFAFWLSAAISLFVLLWIAHQVAPGAWPFGPWPTGDEWILILPIGMCLVLSIRAGTSVSLITRITYALFQAVLLMGAYNLVWERLVMKYIRKTS